MTGVAWRDNVPGPCPRCTGYGDARYLTCPTLRLPRNPVLPVLPGLKRLLTLELPDGGVITGCLSAQEADMPP